MGCEPISSQDVGLITARNLDCSEPPLHPRIILGHYIGTTLFQVGTHGARRYVDRMTRHEITTVNTSTIMLASSTSLLDVFQL